MIWSILAVYIIGIFVFCYAVGRLDVKEALVFVLVWPILLVMLPFFYFARFCFRLGERHQ